MSSSTKPLAKLTSLSTQTLSLLLERQRLQSFPSASLNSTSQSKSLHATQITKNLQQLRSGILEMEEKDGRTEAIALLRGQYERMRGMLGDNPDGINVESLDPPAPPPSASISSSSSDSLPRAPSPPMVLPPTPPGKDSGEFQYTPYKDDPETEPPLDDTGIMLQQRMMMNEQDDHLDRLSQSISRQHHISLQINDELDVHSGLLEELDTDIDRTHSRLSSARRRLDRVAQGAKENSSAVAIGVIIFILLILIIIFKT
ncbi:Syntaxin-52 [Leucoagaricus sp. SymC.cos]|nr:Syntaxin-52 [Leucoagaricus sp. SymC.cos]